MKQIQLNSEMPCDLNPRPCHCSLIFICKSLQVVHFSFKKSYAQQKTQRECSYNLLYIFLFAVVLYCGQTVCLVISVLICAILYHNFKTEVRVVNVLYFICSSLSSNTLNAICLPHNNTTALQSFHSIFTFSKVDEYNSNSNKKKRKSELVYHFIICITMEKSQWPKKQSF